MPEPSLECMQEYRITNHPIMMPIAAKAPTMYAATIIWSFAKMAKMITITKAMLAMFDAMDATALGGLVTSR